GEHRDLDHDVVAQRRVIAGLAHHVVVRGSDDLGRDRPLHHVADLDQDVLELAPGLGDERRVGGDPVDQPHRGRFPDLLDICSIDEELHGGPPLHHSRRGRSVPALALYEPPLTVYNPCPPSVSVLSIFPSASSASGTFRSWTTSSSPRCSRVRSSPPPSPDGKIWHRRERSGWWLPGSSHPASRPGPSG